MIDIWQEIMSVIRKNKLRTFLTGFSVAWGIFMLIILLGAGNGLKNAILTNFQGNAINSIFIWNGTTSMKYQGYNSGRKITFKTEDLKNFEKIEKRIDNISGRFWLPVQNLPISYKNENSTYSIIAVNPPYIKVVNYKMINGRFINDIDLNENRKVAVIGYEVAKKLFKDEDPINKYMKMGSAMFQVVGVYCDRNNYENKIIIIPISTSQKIYNSYEKLHDISLTTGNMSVAEVKTLESSLRSYLSRKYIFDKNDYKAIGMYNSLQDYQDFLTVFSGITLFIWIIGIGTIIAGIVGVSNIMLISVRERTKEIGIRKALGAKPRSITSIIILEAIIITGAAGYIGMVAGIGVLETINYFMEKSAAATAAVATSNEESFSIFLNPTVDIRIAISATILLIICGTLAGFFPARKAASIRPIVALRDE